jgi:hypothetical protein
VRYLQSQSSAASAEKIREYFKFDKYFLSARQLVRDKRRIAQDGGFSRVIPCWESDFLALIDEKARTMDPHSCSMETHRARHRRTSDYHHVQPRQPS